MERISDRQLSLVVMALSACGIIGLGMGLMDSLRRFNPNWDGQVQTASDPAGPPEAKPIGTGPVVEINEQPAAQAPPPKSEAKTVAEDAAEDTAATTAPDGTEPPAAKAPPAKAPAPKAAPKTADPIGDLVREKAPPSPPPQPKPKADPPPEIPF